MFGHQNNEQDELNTGSQPDNPSPSNQSVPASEPFNPALPSSSFTAASFTAPVSPDPAAPTPLPVEHSPTTIGNDELLDIKQQALSQLSPLVGHLEQTPEEKFRTTMMMIQASDNQDLVKDAYAAAQAITDEKIKAQALLDIVNEINYFTQHHQA